MPVALLKNGNKVSFNLHNVKIYNTSSFKAVTVVAVANYRAVRQFNVDPNVLYNACVPFIPNGTSTRVEDWEFVVIENSNGKLETIPIPAIQADSIQLAKPSKLTVIIDEVQSEDVEKIIHAINALGYDNLNSYSS